jgi:hypothetical protein
MTTRNSADAATRSGSSIFAMGPAKIKDRPGRADSSPASTPASPALEWLWHYLRDVQHPGVLDCGPAAPSTIGLLLRRKAKVYVADLLSPLQRGEPGFWKNVDKQKVFWPDKFLEQLPAIPAGTVSVICAWHVLDLIPPGERMEVVQRFFQYLEPGGVFFAILREPHLTVGMDTHWRLESMTTLRLEGAALREFPYPAHTNRDLERLVPTASVKTFLTRSRRREVILLKER